MPKVLAKIDKTCQGCGCMAAEVIAPNPYHREPGPGEGEGSRRLCYLCAHVVDAHGVEPTDTEGISREMAGCGCSGEAIYPADVLAVRRAGGLMAAARAEVRATQRAATAEADDRRARVERYRESAAEAPLLLARAPAAVGSGTCEWPGCGRTARPPSTRRCGHHDGGHQRSRA